MAIRAVFLDRDGTINVERNYVHRIEDFEFLPGAVAAMARLASAGIDIIVVSNQSGIARGLHSEADLAAVNAYMTAELLRHGVKVADIYVCPHHPQAAVPRYRTVCACRKPSPGLLLTAMREHGIAASDAVMIGDQNSDVEAGRAAGLITYLVQTGYGAKERRATNATYIFPDLASAVNHIVVVNQLVAAHGQKHEIAE